MWRGVFSNPINDYIFGKPGSNRKDNKTARFEDNTLCSFLNQAANIEMVVLILSGIK